MKLRQLHINSFGHFAECDLVLPSEGLQVIYGPNEAGKTTLLEFLRGWLFDFPVRTPYDFKAGAEIAGVGTMVLSDGRTVELRRRKGNKNKVIIKIDGRDTDLDEVGFQRLIGHANQGLFESVFSFGLDQLSSGKENLKHESLQSALFGGGLGAATSPDRILQLLDTQAREIFDANAQKKTAIRGILGEIKELSKQINSSSLRSDDYQKCRQVASDAEANAAELHRHLNEMRVEHLRVEKLCRAHQKWAELEQRRLERQPLSAPVTLPLDARARYASLKGTLKVSNEETERLTNTIQSIERELATLQLDPRSVSFRAEIRSSLELRQSYVEARRDLPRLRADHDETAEQIDRELAELRPGWGRTDLLTFRVDIATRSEINRLVEEDRDRANAETELRARRDQLTAQLTQAKADLESVGEVRDASALAVAVATESAYDSDRKELEKRIGEAAKISRQLVTRVKKLSPSLPDSKLQFFDLAVPKIESIARFEAEFAESNESLRATFDLIREDERQLDELRETISQTEFSNAIPTLEERDAARRRRDASWEVIRHQFIERRESWNGPAPELLGDAYEQSVRDADRLDDLIYANADAVAHREELIRQSEAATRRVAVKRNRIQELQNQREELQQRWLALWSSCEFEPAAPDVMRRWLADYEVVCETFTKQSENREDVDALQQRISAFEQKLRLASNAPEGDVQILLAKAHQAVDEAKESQRRTKELQRDIKRAGAQLVACDQEIAAIESKQSTWQTTWKSVLERLRLPTEWDTELARSVIERLVTTRVKLDSLPQEEARLTAMQDRLDEFEARIRPLCETLSPDLLREPPELASEKLSNQLEQAIEAQKQHDQLTKQLKAASNELRQAQDRLTKMQSERSELLAAAEADSEDQFLVVVDRAEKIRQLDADLRRLTSDLDQIRSGEDREEFERSLTNLDAESLEVRRQELAEQIEVVSQQSRTADGAAAVAKSELARLDGSSTAALLTDELARKRSLIASEVDRYVPLIFAKHLLSEAVRRFDRENQPEMIKTVSTLISQMTGGRYVEFDRTRDSSQSILIRRSDGVERTPEQLSTGTREQLYLAIRLAYVLHYCRQNEPLPIVMDDVLVNFDDTRARQTLTALSEVAKTVQVLFFTCHPHMVQLAQEVVPDLKPTDLPSSTSPPSSSPPPNVTSAVPSLF